MRPRIFFLIFLILTQLFWSSLALAAAPMCEKASDFNAIKQCDIDLCRIEMRTLGCSQFNIVRDHRRDCSKPSLTPIPKVEDVIPFCFSGYVYGTIESVVDVVILTAKLLITVIEELEAPPSVNNAPDQAARNKELIAICDKSIDCKKILVANSPLATWDDKLLSEISTNELLLRLRAANESKERVQYMQSALRGPPAPKNSDIDNKRAKNLLNEFIMAELERQKKKMACMNAAGVSFSVCEALGNILGPGSALKLYKGFKAPGVILGKTLEAGSIANLETRVYELKQIGNTEEFASRMKAKKNLWSKEHPGEAENFPVPEFKNTADEVEKFLSEADRIIPSQKRQMLKDLEALRKAGYPYNDTLRFFGDTSRVANIQDVVAPGQLKTLEGVGESLITIVAPTTEKYYRKRGITLLPTTEEVSVETMNRLFAQGVAPIGLSTKAVVGDGVRINSPRFFYFHDLQHARDNPLIVSTTEGKYKPSDWTDFFKKVESVPDKNQRDMIELTFFQAFHEGEMKPEKFATAIEKSSEMMNLESSVRRKLETEWVAYSTPGADQNRDLVLAIEWLKKNIPKPSGQ